MTLPDPAPVIDLIEAFRRSKTMFAAVELGIFDLLAGSPASASALASATGTHAGALERLLEACAGLGFLRKREGLYENLPVADVYLRRNSPRTLAGYILYSNRQLFRLWANLEDAVREATPRWKQTFGPDGAIFDHFFRTDEDMRVFLLGMHGFGLLSSPAVVRAFDLSRFRRLVDLGGATGHLAIEACRRYPGLHAAIFDLPRVIGTAREQVDAAALNARIEFVAGDFFTDPLPTADLYAAGRILHDWPEEKIRLLLAKVYASLSAGGGLLIAERLLDDDRAGPVPALMQSLNMLVCTEGKERTAGEYELLLRSAGFTRVESRRTGTPLDALLALK